MTFTAMHLLLSLYCIGFSRYFLVTLMKNSLFNESQNFQACGLGDSFRKFRTYFSYLVGQVAQAERRLATISTTGVYPGRRGVAGWIFFFTLLFPDWS